MSSQEEPGVASDEGAPARRRVVREIDEDEFDPVGTVVLVAIYFAILVLMWTFMYFVEFLGNAPSLGG